jgi:hypothetical protein
MKDFGLTLVGLAATLGGLYLLIGLGLCENDCPEYPAALVATPVYGGLAVTVLGIALILRNAWRRLRRHKTGGDERSPG